MGEIAIYAKGQYSVLESGLKKVSGVLGVLRVLGVGNDCKKFLLIPGP